MYLTNKAVIANEHEGLKKSREAGLEAENFYLFLVVNTYY